MLPPGPPNAVDGHEAPSPQFPSLPYKTPWQYSEYALLDSRITNMRARLTISWQAEGEGRKGQGWKPVGKLTRLTLLLT